MPKVRIRMFAEKYDASIDEVIGIAKDKLASNMISGRGMNLWVSEEGQPILHEALEFIPEIVPKHFTAKVLRFPPNPGVVLARVPELRKNVAVIIPRSCNRLRMKGKTITVEQIVDDRGETYRFNKPKLFRGA